MHFCFSSVISESSKKKIDVLLPTAVPKSDTTGKKFHLDKNKKKSIKLKRSYLSFLSSFNVF